MTLETNAKLILIFLTLLVIYTLHCTFVNDYGIFLLILILLLSCLFIYQCVKDEIFYYLDRIEKQIYNIPSNIKNINNTISKAVEEQMHNFTNIKYSIFN